MRKCIICGKPCTFNAKYCIACGRMLRNNWSIAYKLLKKYKVRLCPMCFVNDIKSGDVFCRDCKSRLFVRKHCFSKKKTLWRNIKKITRRSFTNQ